MIRSNGRSLLIIEDDPNFAHVLVDLARERGFEPRVASQGAAALTLAQEWMPDAVTLDLHLPDMDGWTVLDRLKANPATRAIPVHIISVEEQHERGLEMGAVACLTKPVSKASLDQLFDGLKGDTNQRVLRLLLVEDDEIQRNAILDLVSDGSTQTTAVGSGAAALKALQSSQFDCMVLDLGLPDMTGFQLIERLKKLPGLSDLPIIIYTAKTLTKREETRLRRVAKTIIVKDTRSPERLLDELSLFLAEVQHRGQPAPRPIPARPPAADQVLAGKKVLIVDDDIRNIFALTSVLERYDMEILSAENGKDAIDLLEATPGIDLVLMDIMMPEMDGYETMRSIRKLPAFETLPVIALTAKAMKGDREKCVEAGASDYIAKPVETEQLLSLLRVWLYHEAGRTREPALRR